MNNIENESTFFVSIERRKVNINNANLKNNKFQDFLKYINRKKINNSVEKASNLRSSYNNISNSNKENFSQKNIANNIINLKANNNIITNKPKHIEKNEEKNKKEIKEPNILLPFKKILDEDMDLNINDTDEYNNKIHINIHRPKLPNHNMNYFENLSNSNSIINSQNINPKSDIFMNENYSKSCSFENKNLIKWKINHNINILTTKIDMLKNLIKRRQKEILELQLFFQKNKSHQKFKKNILQFDTSISELKKLSLKLKAKKLKLEEKYISKKKYLEEIKRENLHFANAKSDLIEKIMDCKLFIMEHNNPKEVLLTYNDEATIVNDSYIFENHLNTLDEKDGKESNIIEIKNADTKNISLNNVTEDEDIVKINFNEMNCFENKDTNNYFTSKFLVEMKKLNKNQTKSKNPANSKFNILININK